MSNGADFSSTSTKVHNSTYYSNNSTTDQGNGSDVNCGNMGVSTDFPAYVNEFIVSQPENIAPPAMNYFHHHPSSLIEQPLSDMQYDKMSLSNNDNAVIILDDVAQPSDEANFGHDLQSCNQSGSNLLESHDFITSAEIIDCDDILDLTTDEVEQIFDDNSSLMNNHIFNNSSLLPIEPKSQLLDVLPKVTIDTEPIKLATTESSTTTTTTGKVKRKGGRPKGARKSCKFSCSLHSNPLHF